MSDMQSSSGSQVGGESPLGGNHHQSQLPVSCLLLGNSKGKITQLLQCN
jgi:hypothetical protein